MTEGLIEDVRAEGTVLTYCRRAGERRLRIALNLGHEPASLRSGERGRLLVTTRSDEGAGAIGPIIELGADEGVVVALD